MNDPSNIKLAQAGFRQVSNDIVTLDQLELVFGNIVFVILGIAGVILFIIIIIGGFKYATSAGDPQKAEEARKTLTSGIVGFLIVAFAYLILVLIKQITGAPITGFKIVEP